MSSKGMWGSPRGTPDLDSDCWSGSLRSSPLKRKFEALEDKKSLFVPEDESDSSGKAPGFHEGYNDHGTDKGDERHEDDEDAEDDEANEDDGEQGANDDDDDDDEEGEDLECDYDETQEPLPNVPIYDPGIADLHATYVRKLEELERILSPFAGISDAVREFLGKVKALKQIPETKPLDVAFMGETGVGKYLTTCVRMHRADTG